MSDEEAKKPIIEIEAPTEEQRTEVLARDIIEFAESGVPEIQIVSRLMAMGVPRAEAEAQLPKILDAAKGKRRRKLWVRKIGGAVLALGGFGTGIYLWIGGVIWIWPFLIGVIGMAIFIGYLDSLFDVF